MNQSTDRNTERTEDDVSCLQAYSFSPPRQASEAMVAWCTFALPFLGQFSRGNCKVQKILAEVRHERLVIGKASPGPVKEWVICLCDLNLQSEMIRNVDLHLVDTKFSL